MNYPANKALADQIIDSLPNDVKARLKAVFREHGRNRHAMRATARIIQHALVMKVHEKKRDEVRAEARREHAIAQAERVNLRGRPLPGMTQERFELLLSLDMPGAIMVAAESSP